MKAVFIVLALALTGCFTTENKPIAKEEFYDMDGMLKDLMDNCAKHQFSVKKSAMVNGHSEEKIIEKADSTFWKRELSLLFEADLNKPINVGAYTIHHDLSDSSSNLRFDQYLKKNNYQGVQWENIYYLSTPAEIRKIAYERLENNSLFISKRRVHLWINRYGDDLLIDSLKVIGSSKMIGQDSLNYKITSKVIH